MAGLGRRLAEAEAAFATLGEVVGEADRSLLQRDGAILRLIYTFEAMWKASQQLLAEREGVEVASPNGAIRAARRLGCLSDEDAQAGNPSSRDGNLGSRRARSAREHPPPGVGRGQRDGSAAAGG